MVEVKKITRNYKCPVCGVELSNGTLAVKHAQRTKHFSTQIDETFGRKKIGSSWNSND